MRNRLSDQTVTGAASQKCRELSPAVNEDERAEREWLVNWLADLLVRDYLASAGPSGPDRHVRSIGSSDGSRCGPGRTDIEAA